MLGCARIGAVHSVVFGGFAANELASRIDDSPKQKLFYPLHVGTNQEKQLNINHCLKKQLS